MKQTFNPCDECSYNFSKNNQESKMCKICEFKKSIDKELKPCLTCDDMICVYWCDCEKIKEWEDKQKAR